MCRVLRGRLATLDLHLPGEVVNVGQFLPDEALHLLAAPA